MMNNAPRLNQNSVVAIFSQHSAAEDAIKELKDGGFDIKKLAVVGRADCGSQSGTSPLDATRNFVLKGKWRQELTGMSEDIRRVSFEGLVAVGRARRKADRFSLDPNF